MVFFKVLQKGKLIMRKLNKKLSAVGKKLLNITLAVIVITGMIPSAAVTAHAAGGWPGSASKPVKAYTISNSNNTTAYSTSDLTAKKGTVYASDECYIKTIKQNSRGKWVANITYPTGRGRKDAWVPLSVFTSATTPGAKSTATGSFNTVRRPGGSKAGSVSKNDTVYRLGSSNGYVQILYNIGSASSPTGWRMAWVNSSTYNNYVKSSSAASSSSSTTVSKGQNPRGCIDLVKALDTPNSFYVELWASDFDTSNSIDVHIYVNGPAGSGAKGYSYKCSQSRPDVKNAFPGQCKTQYTGLKKTITIQGLEGNTTLYFYAINASGTGGQNVFLGQRTVNIKGAAKNQTNSNSSSNNATVSGYAAYNGFDYKAALKKLLSNGTIGQTEYNNRLALLQEAQKMVTVLWKSPVSFHSWKSSAGSYNSNKSMQYGTKPSSSSQFVKGYTYQGIPYRANAGYNNYNAEEWTDLVKRNTAKSVFEGSVTYLGIRRSATTYRGVDCSGFVHNAYSKISSYTYTDSNRLSCSGMMNTDCWKKINASDAKPGDILLKSGHVMIYLGKTSTGKVAVFESVADGTNGTSGCRYFEFSSVSSYNYYRFTGIAGNSAVAGVTSPLQAILGSYIRIMI